MPHTRAVRQRHVVYALSGAADLRDAGIVRLSEKSVKPARIEKRVFPAVERGHAGPNGFVARRGAELA